MSINPLKNKFEFCAALILGLGAFLVRNIFLFHTFLPGVNSFYGAVARALFVATMTYLALTLPKIIRTKKRNRTRLPEICWGRKSIITCAAILFACWLPYLIIFYPCVDNWDTFNQIRDFYDGASSDLLYNSENVLTERYQLSDHHPVFDTLIFGGFVELFGKLGNENMGYFVYALLQTVATAVALASVVCFLEKFRTPRWFRIAALLFFALMPLFPLYAINMLKDSLNALVFVPYFLLYLSLAFDLPIKKRGKISFIVLSILLALTKKTFAFILLPANLLLLCKKSATRKERLYFVSSALLPLFIISVVLGKLLFPALNIYPGPPAESIGNLLQQSARVVIDHGESVSDADKEILGRMININRLDKYDWTTSDGVKYIAAIQPADSKTKLDYLSLWIRQAFRYPGTYIRADLSMTGGYFVAEHKAQIYLELHPFRQAKNPDCLGVARAFVGKAYDKASKLPIIGFLFEVSLYTWWIPVLSFLFIMKNRSDKRKYLIAFAPILVQIFVMLLTPLINVRYALPMVYVAPLLLGMCFGLPEKRKSRR